MNYYERLKEIQRKIYSEEGALKHKSYKDLQNVYFNSTDKDDYYSIKYDDVNVNLQNTGIVIEFGENWQEELDKFNLGDWLTKVEKVLEEKTIILDGKTYKLIPKE